VIPVRVADQEDLDVAELEPELLDARFDQRNVRLEIAVDEDVPLRRGDEIVRQPFAADVVQIPGDAKCGERFGPVRALLRRRVRGNSAIFGASG